MISCMISYHIKDLTVPSPEEVAFQIERIASCLGPSTVELTLPLNATECPKLPFAPVAGNQVVLQDGVQLPRSPLHVPLGGYLQLLPKILTNPCCKFCRQPADNRMGFAKRILKPLLPRQLAIICLDIAFLNGPHQSLVHVMVNLIRVEVWMVKNPLYQIFQLSSVGIVFTDMVLQDAFAP